MTGMIVYSGRMGQALYTPWAPSYIGPGRPGETAPVMQTPAEPPAAQFVEARLSPGEAGSPSGDAEGGGGKPAAGSSGSGFPILALVIFGASAALAAISA